MRRAGADAARMLTPAVTQQLQDLLDAGVATACGARAASEARHGE
jgi:hypothetical protein